MASNELLGIYLNDHLAGASAGTEISQKISSENTGTPLGNFMTELTRDIEQDRATLEDLITRLGFEKNPAKEAAGWFFEKVSRLRFSVGATGGSDLKLLMELETLSLGIEGKLAMWHSLQQVSEDTPELATTDLADLAKRAEDQRSTLEQHRLEVARRALTSAV